jgi:hypothetical protein
LSFQFLIVFLQNVVEEPFRGLVVGSPFRASERLAHALTLNSIRVARFRLIQDSGCAAKKRMTSAVIHDFRFAIQVQRRLYIQAGCIEATR